MEENSSTGEVSTAHAAPKSSMSLNSMLRESYYCMDTRKCIDNDPSRRISLLNVNSSSTASYKSPSSSSTAIRPPPLSILPLTKTDTLARAPTTSSRTIPCPRISDADAERAGQARIHRITRGGRRRYMSHAATDRRGKSRRWITWKSARRKPRVDVSRGIEIWREVERGGWCGGGYWRCWFVRGNSCAWIGGGRVLEERKP